MQSNVPRVVAMGYEYFMVESNPARVSGEIPMNIIEKLDHIELRKDSPNEFMVYIDSIFNLHDKIDEVYSDFELIRPYLVKEGEYVMAMDVCEWAYKIIVTKEEVKIIEGKMVFKGEKELTV